MAGLLRCSMAAGEVVAFTHSGLILHSTMLAILGGSKGRRAGMAAALAALGDDQVNARINSLLGGSD